MTKSIRSLKRELAAIKKEAKKIHRKPKKKGLTKKQLYQIINKYLN